MDWVCPKCSKGRIYGNVNMSTEGTIACQCGQIYMPEIKGERTMDIKIGDKVTGFDGEKMFEGVVRSIQSYKVKDIGIIKDNKEDQYFNHKYVYPTGTTIKVIPAIEVIEGWYNMFSDGGMASSMFDTEKIAKDSRSGPASSFFGPPIHITQTSIPDTVTINMGAWEKIKQWSKDCDEVGYTILGKTRVQAFIEEAEVTVETKEG